MVCELKLLNLLKIIYLYYIFQQYLDDDEVFFFTFITYSNSTWMMMRYFSFGKFSENASIINFVKIVGADTEILIIYILIQEFLDNRSQIRANSYELKRSLSCTS